MRTARLLTVSQHALLEGGVPAWGYLLGGTRQGVYLPGGTYPGGTCPGTPPCEQNDWETGVKT